MLHISCFLLYNIRIMQLFNSGINLKIYGKNNNIYRATSPSETLTQHFERNSGHIDCATCNIVYQCTTHCIILKYYWGHSYKQSALLSITSKLSSSSTSRAAACFVRSLRHVLLCPVTLHLQKTVQANWADKQLHLFVEQGFDDEQVHLICSMTAVGDGGTPAGIPTATKNFVCSCRFQPYYVGFSLGGWRFGVKNQ